MTEDDPESLKQQMGDLSTEPPKEKPVSAKKKAKKVAKKTSATKSNGSAPKDENVVSLKDLAKSHGLKEAVARRKLRAAGLETEGRWRWEKGSAGLKKAEAALSAVEE